MKRKEAKKDILEEKLLKGLSLAYERMIAEKRKNKQKIVVWREGKIVKEAVVFPAPLQPAMI